MPLLVQVSFTCSVLKFLASFYSLILQILMNIYLINKLLGNKEEYNDILDF